MRVIQQLSVLVVAGSVVTGLSIGCAAATPTGAGTAAPGKPHSAARGTDPGAGPAAAADRHPAVTGIGTGNFRIDSGTQELDVVDPVGAIVVRIPLDYAPRVIPSRN